MAVLRSAGIVGVTVGGILVGAATLGSAGVHEAGQLLSQAQPLLHASTGFDIAAAIGGGVAFIAQPVGVGLKYDAGDYYAHKAESRTAVHNVVRRVGVNAVAVATGLVGVGAALAAVGHGGADPAILDVAGAAAGIGLGAWVGNATIWRRGRIVPQKALSE